MSGHLCLKWNNHSSAFLKSISNIQIKERYCDATIACQGKYFPVHRIILSTCSDYFDEIFERMECPHPYIVFKDIEPCEMELLLNYMYQGEVNVVQEKLPSLIKAAEALKIKGLAVPDDLPSNKDSSSKKRSNTSQNEPEPKRRQEGRNRRNSVDFSSHSETDNIPLMNIKEEPQEVCEDGVELPPPFPEEPILNDDSTSLPSNSQGNVKEEDGFTDFPIVDNAPIYFKTEEGLSAPESFDEQSSSWSGFGSESLVQNLPSPMMSKERNMIETNQNTEEEEQYTMFRSQHDQQVYIPSETNMVSTNSSITTKDTAANKNSNTNPFPHMCPHCDYGTNYKGSIKKHIMNKHTFHRPFKCGICLKQFGEKQTLMRHTNTHKDVKPFACPFCKYKYSCQSNLHCHIKKKHHDKSTVSDLSGNVNTIVANENTFGNQE